MLFSFPFEENIFAIYMYFLPMYVQLWEEFGDVIQETKQRFLEESDHHPTMTPYYSGRGLNLQLKITRIKNLRDCFDRAHWLPYCSTSDQVCHQYELLVASLENAIKDLHNKWIDSVEPDPTVLLNRFLMIYKVSLFFYIQKRKQK